MTLDRLNKKNIDYDLETLETDYYKLESLMTDDVDLDSYSSIDEDYSEIRFVEDSWTSEFSISNFTDENIDIETDISNNSYFSHTYDENTSNLDYALSSMSDVIIPLNTRDMSIHRTNRGLVFTVDITNLSSYSEESDVQIIESTGNQVRGGALQSTIDNEESDLVVLESCDLRSKFPRIDQKLMCLILSKLFSTYFDSMRGINGNSRRSFYRTVPLQKLSPILKELSDEEIAYLKSKVRSALVMENTSLHMLNLLVDMIHPDKIDTNLVINRHKPAKYKNLINCIDKDCIICYEQFTQNSMCISLKCAHVFHSKCINRWLKTSWVCPVCRVDDI